MAEIINRQTNPAPLGAYLHNRTALNGDSDTTFVPEAIICRHPSVRAAMMFGRERFHAGVLIDPAEGKAFDPSDLVQLAAFRNKIW